MLTGIYQCLICYLYWRQHTCICFPLKITQNVKCNIDVNGCISVFNVCYRLQVAHMQMLKALHPWLMFIMYMGSTENLMRSHHEWPESPSSCWKFHIPWNYFILSCAYDAEMLLRAAFGCLHEKVGDKTGTRVDTKLKVYYQAYVISTLL